MNRNLTELTTCPDCSQEVTCLFGIYSMHYRPVSLTRREVCPASNMPVLTETRPLVPVDPAAGAWAKHVEDGGD